MASGCGEGEFGDVHGRWRRARSKLALAIGFTCFSVNSMKSIASTVLLLLVLSLSGATADKPLGKTFVKHVDAKAASKLIKANKGNDGFVILDVRTPAENQEVRLANATNIDIRSSKFAAKANKLDKERTYLVHCRSGGRSTTALKALQKLGFLKLYHLDGGMNAWQKEGLQVVKGK